MPKHRTVNFIADEPFSICKLEDGTVFKVKHVFMHVARKLDDNGKPIFNEHGVPQYRIDVQSVMQIVYDTEDGRMEAGQIEAPQTRN
jgi:hypothetical protein